MSGSSNSFARSKDGGRPVLTATTIFKSYGGVKALKGVDLRLFSGEVHGLCGENGSGKSTLLKILSAQVRRDSGSIQIAEQEVSFDRPDEALSAGISTVTQELTLVSELSIAENVLMGPRKPRSWRGIDWKATALQAELILSKLGCEFDVMRPVSDLALGEQQMVEIARALSSDLKILILDEPTSSLANHEVDALLNAVRTLSLEGVATIFISHRMEEVFAICDRLTVIRDGRLVSSGMTSQYNPHSLVTDMLGREPEFLVQPTRSVRTENPILAITDLCVPGKLRNLHFDLFPGEIVGLAGLVGSGQVALLETLFGESSDMTGKVVLEGKEFRANSPVAAMRQGVGFVPGDRKGKGLVLAMSVGDNLFMAESSKKQRFLRANGKKIVERVRAAIATFGIIAESGNVDVLRLSGGNQQKVLLAKWLHTNPKILLLDEPTRGVDVGAKIEIHRLLRNQAAKGLSILLSSSELPELIQVCDRILVMYKGSFVAEFSSENAKETEIMSYAMGHGA
jgi:ABC-type sugar transport system ATPase subunit